MDPAATRSFFAAAGVPSVVEEDGRVVPTSHRAVDLRRALCDKLEENHVRTVTHATIKAIRTATSGFDVVLRDTEQHFDAVILATGGCSYSETGSDGSGFELARRLGHKIVHPVPGEVPLVTSGLELERLQGLTALDVEVSVQREKGLRRRGNVLFTHFGVSGPAVLDISADVSERIAQGTETTLLIDFVPHLDAARLEQMVTDSTRRTGLLADLVAKRLASVIAEKIGSDTGKAAIEKTVEMLKKFPITIARTRGFDAAMITRGGVDLCQVDAATMQSKLVPGLYFAGEILDLDGPMGGFNLQTAWSTGCLAGAGAAGD
jgi:predicted Rossmann fold flavoprotein